jgi:hypothetical protein
MRQRNSWRTMVMTLVAFATVFAVVETSEAGRRCGRRRGGCGNSCGYSSCNYNYQSGCGNSCRANHSGPGIGVQPMPVPSSENEPLPPQASNGQYQQQFRTQSGYRGVAPSNSPRTSTEQLHPQPTLAPDRAARSAKAGTAERR